jgi:magnesium dechelatase
MKELRPEKLHVTFHEGTSAQEPSLPRRYTLTHSDTTGDLFLSIGAEYDRKQISGFYTRLMRDEVLAELKDDGQGISLHVYCHISGGLVFGTAGWRNDILHHHMRMVLEALRHGDRELVSSNPDLNRSIVQVHFASNHKRYNCVEAWGPLQDYE